MNDLFLAPEIDGESAVPEVQRHSEQFTVDDVLTLEELKELGDEEYGWYMYAHCSPEATDEAWEIMAHLDLMAPSKRVIKSMIFETTRYKMRQRGRMQGREYRDWCRENQPVWTNLHARRDWLDQEAREATGLLSRRETKAIRAEQEALTAELHASRRLQQRLVGAIYFHRQESTEAGREPLDADLKLWKMLARRPLGLGGRSLDELWGAGHHEPPVGSSEVSER